MLGYDRNGSWPRSFDERNFADLDASIIGVHILLEVADLALGITWVCCLDPAVLTRFASDMAGYELIALFPLGYPRESAAPSADHNRRKTPAELAEFL